MLDGERQDGGLIMNWVKEKYRWLECQWACGSKRKKVAIFLIAYTVFFLRLFYLHTVRFYRMESPLSGKMTGEMYTIRLWYILAAIFGKSF